LVRDTVVVVREGVCFARHTAAVTHEAACLVRDTVVVMREGACFARDTGIVAGDAS
jgi:hypothetical protein